MKTLKAKRLSWADSTNRRKYFKKYFKPITFSEDAAAWLLISSIRIEHLYNPKRKANIQLGLNIFERYFRYTH